MGGLNVIGQAYPLLILGACLAVAAWAGWRHAAPVRICDRMIDVAIGSTDVSAELSTEPLIRREWLEACLEPEWSERQSWLPGGRYEISNSELAGWARPDADVIGDMQQAMEEAAQRASLADFDGTEPAQYVPPPFEVPPGGWFRDSPTFRTWYRAPGGVLYSWTDEQLRRSQPPPPVIIPTPQIEFTPEQYEVAQRYIDEMVGRTVYAPYSSELSVEQQVQAALNQYNPPRLDIERDDILPGYADREALIEEFRHEPTAPVTDAVREPEPYEADPSHWVNKEHP